MSGVDFARAVGASLRKIRLRHGMSLQDVQAASGGRWKAAVVGAYERGDRNVTVARLFELAEFYGVPIADALPGASPEDAAPAPLDAVPILLKLDNLERVPPTERDALQRLIAAVQGRRSDREGDRLRLREDDLRTLAFLYGIESEELRTRLRGWGLI